MGHFIVANGAQIYEIGAGGLSTDSYLNEAVCFGTASGGENGLVELQLMLDPATGARTVYLNILWYVDPYTLQRYDDKTIRWKGNSIGAFPVTRQDGGATVTFKSADFELDIPQQAGGRLTLPDGSLRMNLFGRSIAFTPVDCAWSGQ
jgi:hypothetical protein